MIVILLLTALLGVVFLATAVLPAVLAAPVERALAAAHAKLDRGDSALTRFAPFARLVRVIDTPLLAGLAVLLLAGAGLFAGLLDEVAEGAPIVTVDAWVFHFLQAQRTDLLDRIMIALTGLGDQNVVMPVAFAALLALGVLQQWRAALYLLIATAGAAVFVGLIKKWIARPRPISIYDGIVQYSFPSGHACMSIVLYGFLGFLLAYGAPQAWRRGLAVGAMLLIGLISFSRVYLGAHWMSDVLAGLGLGLAWVGLLIVLYIHGRPRAISMPALGSVVLLVTLVAGTTHVVQDFGRERGRYTAHAAPASAPLSASGTSAAPRLP